MSGVHLFGFQKNSVPGKEELVVCGWVASWPLKAADIFALLFTKSVNTLASMTYTIGVLKHGLLAYLSRK